MYLNAVLSHVAVESEDTELKMVTFDSGMRGCGWIRQYTAVLISSIL